MNALSGAFWKLIYVCDPFWIQVPHKLFFGPAVFPTEDENFPVSEISCP